MSTAEEAVEEIVSILEVLREYVKEQRDGAMMGFVEVEQATGVRMDQVGRNALKRACKAEKRPFDWVRNCGVRLSAPDNVLAFSQKKIDRVASVAKTAQAFTESLVSRHEAQLRSEDKATLLHRVGVLGGVRLAATYSALPGGNPEPKPDPAERTRGALQMIRRTPPKE